MSETLNARTRILCLIELFNMYSDELHIISIDEICEKINEYGYNVSKRTVLSDIKTINTTPLKIISVNKPKKGFYLAKSYSYQAINLILEAVFSSDILSKDDMKYITSFLYRNFCVPTLDLILETSETYYSALPKKSVSYDVLTNIRMAIKGKKQLSISYSRIVPGDAFSLSERKEKMIVNPIKIAAYGGVLSLIFTCTDTPTKIEFINLPRIKSADVTNEDSVDVEGDLFTATNFFNTQPSNASKTCTEWILLKFKNEDIETVENNFSTPIEFRKSSDPGYCIAKILAVIDPALIGWLLLTGNKIEILKPDSLKELITDKAKNYN